jgi:hypothetical protein
MMADAMELEGKCLCGAVRVATRAAGHDVAACHCTICRNWGGGPLLAVDCGSDFRIANEDEVTVYPSSEWAERGFCRRCGTHLFYRLKQGPRYFVPVGLFGASERWRLGQQIFIDEKPAYYAFANETANLTGAEVFAQFAPQPDRP